VRKGLHSGFLIKSPATSTSFITMTRMAKLNLTHMMGEEMSKQKTALNDELVSLFDLRKSKARDEKILTQEAFEAQRDIRYLTLMFSDGIPDITMKVTDSEDIKWDSRAQKLIYIKDQQAQLLEAASKEVRVKMRPFLTDLVRKAKDFYNDY
jgi:hypothetical protein